MSYRLQVSQPVLLEFTVKGAAAHADFVGGAGAIPGLGGGGKIQMP